MEKQNFKIFEEPETVRYLAMIEGEERRGGGGGHEQPPRREEGGDDPGPQEPIPAVAMDTE